MLDFRDGDPAGFDPCEEGVDGRGSDGVGLGGHGWTWVDMGDQQASDATVTVQKGVNRLELDMGKADLPKLGQLAAGV